MKTNLLFIVIFFGMLIGYSQTTSVPDINFETYLEANGMGNGTVGDGLVTTANINSVTFLDVSSVGNIADLTGVEDFTVLDTLICEANLLTSLDLSQNTFLTGLFANANQLTELNVQNGNNTNFTSFMTSNNPNLTCIQVDDAAYSTANWTNIDPIASFSVSCSSISGVVSFDCTSLTPQQNVQIRATATNTGNIYYTTTDSNGYYSFSINETGIVTTEVVAQNLISTPVNYSNNYVGQTISNQDFCVDSVAIGDDVHVTIIPITPAPRPGFPSTYKICYGNYGSTTVSGNVNYTFDGSKVGSPTSPDSFTQSGSTLTWAYTNLAPFEIRCIEVVIAVNPATGTNAVVSGDYLIHTVTIDPITSDVFPADNFFEIEETVVNAYDPNDITITEGPYIQPSQSSDDLNFRIRFQNTGTASAINIDVKTVLDANIDISTFQPIAGSHAYSISIQNTNEVTFSFANINLDYESNNEPASHGWVTFKVKPVAGFAIGDVINAQADIFFDTNPAIVTNIATVQIAPPTLTYVPDNNFENYLETHDANGNIVVIGDSTSMGNGIANDDYVTKTSINTVNTLNVINISIADMTGIKDFTALESLDCSDNQISSLTLNQNQNLTEVYCFSNQIATLVFGNNPNLITIECYSNLLSSFDVTQLMNLSYIDCGFNPLTSLNFVQNNQLTYLYCGQTMLTQLDLSTNTLLTDFSCLSNSQLTSLNVKNGSNANFNSFSAINNPNLTCIQVDDVAYSTTNWINVDVQTGFNENCALTNVDTYEPNDNFVMATFLPSCTIVNPTIGESGDVDYFIALLEPNLNTKVEIENIPVGLTYRVTLFDHNEQQLGSPFLVDSTQPLTQFVFSTIQNFFYIKIESINANFNINPYQLTVSNPNCSLSLLDYAYQDFQVYPNPVVDILTIESLVVSKYQIVDYLGRIISNGKIEIGQNTIATNNINKGVYFVKIYSENKTYTKKIIKL